MKLEQEFKIGIKDIGMNNKITNVAYLGFLEEIGCYHSDLAGFGINDVDNTRKAWIIMNWKLQVLDRVKYGDKIIAKTWVRPILEKQNFYTYRDFEVYNEEKKIAIASSKWVLFDVDRKKIERITNKIFSNYKPENTKVFKEEENEKIKDVEKIIIKKNYIVQRADIDINKHMHNLNYLKVAYEVLPEEVFFSPEKNNVKITYKHEIILGSKINCYYSIIDNKHIVTLKSEDDRVLHAVIELY